MSLNVNINVFHLEISTASSLITKECLASYPF